MKTVFIDPKNTKNYPTWFKKSKHGIVQKQEKEN